MRLARKSNWTGELCKVERFVYLNGSANFQLLENKDGLELIVLGKSLVRDD